MDKIYKYNLLLFFTGMKIKMSWYLKTLTEYVVMRDKICLQRLFFYLNYVHYFKKP